MKRFLILLGAFLITSAISAQDRSNLSVYGVYSYNPVSSHTGGIDVTAHVAGGRYFHFDAAFEYLGPKTVSATTVFFPKFPLSVGELFIDGALNFRCLGTYDMGIFTAAGSIGYRMDYVRVQAGISTRILIDMFKAAGSDNKNVVERVDFVYRLGFNVRPSTSTWNIGFGVSNFTEFEYERMIQPILYVDGHCDLNDKLTILLETDFKPSGIGNMSSRFWGVNVRCGLRYSF